MVEILITVESFHSVSANNSEHESDRKRKARYLMEVAILSCSKEFSNDQKCPATLPERAVLTVSTRTSAIAQEATFLLPI
jgi:hypothetical protein